MPRVNGKRNTQIPLACLSGIAMKPGSGHVLRSVGWLRPGQIGASMGDWRVALHRYWTFGGHTLD